MKTTHILSLSLLGLVLLGAGCFSADADVELETDVTAQEEQNAPEQEMDEAEVLLNAELSGTYTVDQEASSLTWDAEKVVGAAHEGTVAIESGTLVLVDGEVTDGMITVDMTTITDTDLEGDAKANLETHLKSDDFFGVETYPTATFEPTALTMDGDDYMISGTLTIKGNTGDVRFPATVTETENGLQVVGTVTIDRSEYDVRFGSTSFFDNLGDNVIRDEFSITFDIVLTAEAAADEVDA